MARVPKQAKKRAPSAHSRAARRDTTPTIPLDESKPTHDETGSPNPTSDTNTKDTNSNSKSDSVLARQSNAGITKKKKNKSMSRHQRLRKERGMDRASAFADQLERKVGRSFERGRVVKERGASWEEQNGEAINMKLKAQKSQFAALEGEDEIDSRVVTGDSRLGSDTRHESGGGGGDMAVDAVSGCAGGEEVDEVL